MKTQREKDLIEIKKLENELKRKRLILKEKKEKEKKYSAQKKENNKKKVGKPFVYRPPEETPYQTFIKTCQYLTWSDENKIVFATLEPYQGNYYVYLINGAQIKGIYHTKQQPTIEQLKDFK